MRRGNQGENHLGQLLRVVGVERVGDRGPQPFVVEQVARSGWYCADREQQRVSGFGVHHPYTEPVEPLGQHLVARQDQAAGTRHQPAVRKRHRQGAEVVPVPPGGHCLRQSGIERVPPRGLAPQSRQRVDRVGEPQATYAQGLERWSGRPARPGGRKQPGDDLAEHVNQRCAGHIEHHGVARSQPQLRVDGRWQERRLRQPLGEQVAQDTVDGPERQADRHQGQDARIGGQRADQLGVGGGGVAEHGVAQRTGGDVSAGRVERQRRGEQGRQAEPLVGDGRCTDGGRDPYRKWLQHAIPVEADRPEHLPRGTGTLLGRAVCQQLGRQRALGSDHPPAQRVAVIDDHRVAVRSGFGGQGPLHPLEIDVDAGQRRQGEQQGRVDAGQHPYGKVMGRPVAQRQPDLGVVSAGRRDPRRRTAGGVRAPSRRGGSPRRRRPAGWQPGRGGGHGTR